MLGLEGFGVILAYLLCIVSAVFCIVYGIINWNKSGEQEKQQIAEEIAWEQHEPEIVDAGGAK